MFKLSGRLQGLEESATLAITARAKAMRERGFDVIGFGAGEPDFDTPENIKKAAVKAIGAGKTKYTPVGGIPELKNAIIEKFKRDNGVEYSREEIIVSCGGKHSIFNLFQAILDRGDEVVIQSPYWVSYPAIVMLSGGVPVFVRTTADGGFKMTAEALSSAITPRTRAVIINSPSNPTGAAYTESELRALVDAALKKNVLIVSDEIYEKLVYGGFRHTSVASLSEAAKRGSVVLNGVSKTYSMTGWRIGYAAGPKEIVKAMTDIQSQSTSNPTSISQWASVEALTGPQAQVQAMVAEFEKRRDAMVEGLNSIKGVRCPKPQGAFYVFPDFSSFYGKSFNDKYIEGSVDLAKYLLEDAEVALVPGEPFGDNSCLRLSYATSMEDITEGIKRIAVAMEKLEQD